MSPLRVQLQAGELLFREGDEPGAAFLIESGTVEVKTHQRGREIVLSLLGPGDLVGEMAVMDEAPRTATATAVSAAVLFPLDRQQIADRLAATDPIVRSLLEGQLKRYRVALAALQGKQPAPDAPTPSERLGIGRIRLEAPDGGAQAGTVLFSDATGELAMVASGLPALPEGQEYRCWVEVDGTRVPIGTMYRAGELSYWVGEVDETIGVDAGRAFGVSLMASAADGVDGEVVLLGDT